LFEFTFIDFDQFILLNYQQYFKTWKTTTDTYNIEILQTIWV